MTAFGLQTSYKFGPGGKHMLNVQGDDPIEFEQNQSWAIDNIELLLSMSELLEAGTTVSVATSGSTPAATAAPAAPSGVEVEEDKWGKKFEYNRPDAPDLPDGRGKYILKHVTLKSGEHKLVWVDPVEGPRPVKKGDTKAKAIWVND